MSWKEKCSKDLDENVGSEEKSSNKSENKNDSSIDFFTKAESTTETKDVCLNQEKTTSTPNQTERKIGKYS